MSGSISPDRLSDHSPSGREQDDDDDDDDNFSQEGAADFEEDEVDIEKGDLQKYYEDTANFPKASQKLPFIYGIATSFANPPKLTESPFSHKNFGNKKKAFLHG